MLGASQLHDWWQGKGGGVAPIGECRWKMQAPKSQMVLALPQNAYGTATDRGATSTLREI